MKSISHKKIKTKGYLGNFVGTLRIVGNRLGRPISEKTFTNNPLLSR
jgi:hypothetical protein